MQCKNGRSFLFYTESMALSNRPTTSVKMKPFLKAFMISIYGNEPIFIPKADKLNDLLGCLLSKPPEDYFPEPQTKQKDRLHIIIPYFNYINISSRYYLSATAQKAFEEYVYSLFWKTFIQFMTLSFHEHSTKSTAIDLFIERYELPLTSDIKETLRKASYRNDLIKRKWPVKSRK